MKFNYQARTKTGEIQSGSVEATTREAALNLLRSYNLFVTILEEASPPFYARRLKLFSKIPRKDVIIFSKQLAIMFQSEVPLVESLNTIARQIKNEDMQERVFDIVERVEGGSQLSKALAVYPETFSSFYVNMVKSGEASGKLSDIFVYLADYLEREYDFNRKVKGVMIYPVFLTVVFLSVIGLVVFFVIPQLSQFLAEADRELPAITKFILSSSEFLRSWGLLLLLLPLAGAAFIYFYAKTKEGKSFFDRNLLKAPVLSNLLKNIYLTRVSLNLSTLISGGLPIVQALEVTSNVVGNEVYKNIVAAASEGVKKGEPISVSFARHPDEFPPLFVQMLVVGEKTGRMAMSLKSTVDFYQKETDRALDNFMRLLEPVMIVIFGVLVGGLVASVILPVYQIIGGF